MIEPISRVRRDVSLQQAPRGFLNQQIACNFRDLDCGVDLQIHEDGSNATFSNADDKCLVADSNPAGHEPKAYISCPSRTNFASSPDDLSRHKVYGKIGQPPLYPEVVVRVLRGRRMLCAGRPTSVC